MKPYKFYHTGIAVDYFRIKIDSDFENDWLKIKRTEYGVVEISVMGSAKQPYAWDGCSPKFKLFQFLIGTPDGMTLDWTRKPITYYSSLYHDALYQFKKEIPLTRAQADYIFCHSLRYDYGFKWWWLYYLAVRMLGWIMGSWKKKAKKDLKPQKVKNIKHREVKAKKKAVATKSKAPEADMTVKTGVRTNHISFY